LNQVAVFYTAMELFARKHHSTSRVMLLLLRSGIWMRSLLAHANRHRRRVAVITLDLLTINGALLLATKLRFGAGFGFPPYAYPDVFIALTVATVCSMLMAGEYFEPKPSLRRATAGLMVNFFLLTALTYFFKDFAFSRVVLIMLISFGVLSTALIRVLMAAYDKSLGREADRRIAIVGANEAAAHIIRSLQRAEARNADVVGIVSVEPMARNVFCDVPIIGSLPQLSGLIEQHRLGEIIIADNSMQRKDLMAVVAKASAHSARFHVAMDYEDVVTSRIINEVAGIEPSLPPYNLARIRDRAAKRLIDCCGSLIALTVGLPFIFLIAKAPLTALENLWGALRGKYSIVGLYPLDDKAPIIGKIGLTGLAHISKPSRLSPEVIRELNEYYVQHHTLTLDFDILLRGFFRNSSGSLESNHVAEPAKYANASRN
jgi:lipopolysaccharide/colanic/teichoic acid biosynthesis glycosyltransferase